MYRVLCDDIPIYDLRDEELTLIDPKLTLEVNSHGSFECRIPPIHPRYDLPVKMLSRITVVQDDVELFKGRITQTKIDYYNRKYIYCEGELAFLNDSVQRPAEYHDMTVRGYLAKLIELHNEQVEEDKRFEVGIVTVTDPNDSLYRYTNWENTLTTIKEDLISSLGGYIRVRNANGHRYIDLIKDYGNINTQVIEFGENLLDFTRHLDLTDIATVVVPLGARLEESSIQALEERLTIESVNGGKDYLVNTEAVKQYGWVVKVVTWDDVTTPERLKVKGQNWLNDEQFDAMTIEAKAIDLHYVDDSQETFKLGDSVRIVSAVHGLDRYFPVTKLTISLNNLGNNTVTFNGTVKVSVSTRSNAVSQSLRTTIEQIPTKNAVVQEAINQAAALITAATHGYVTITEDASELLIADNADYKKATKLWRWNLNGLGYSNTGYNGTYATAITMDGQILGDRLVGNSVDASKLTISYKSAVTKEIADAADSARDDAEGYTDNKLKSYYTKSEVETSISNTKDAVLLSAKETAVQYVDGKLKNYSTSAEIKVTTDAISSQVAKKVGYSEVISSINQTAEKITIKASKISLEGLVTANSNFKILTDGSIEAKNGTFQGKITGSDFKITRTDGTKISIDNNGILIDATKTSNIFYKQGGKLQVGTYGSILPSMFSPITYTDSSNKLWTMPLSDGVSKFRFVFRATASNYLEITTLFGAYGLTAWSSDRRLKDNIERTSLNGCEQVKQFSHYSFDWKETGGHVNCGYIAQDMMQLNRDYVLCIQNMGNDGKLNGKTTYQIDERFVIPVLSKALQELIIRVETLEGRLNNG